MYGLKIKDVAGEPCLCLDRNNSSYLSMYNMFHACQQQVARLESGEISREEYDEWRYFRRIKRLSLKKK